MRRSTAAALLLAACVVLALATTGTALAKKKKQKVKTEVVVKAWVFEDDNHPFGETGTLTYWTTGEVMTAQKKCKKGRTVKILGQNGALLAVLKSRGNGGFQTAALSSVAGNTYAYAVVPKKKKGKTICKRGASPLARFTNSPKPYPGY
jgi:hypothetical protein